MTPGCELKNRLIHEYNLLIKKKETYKQPSKKLDFLNKTIKTPKLDLFNLLDHIQVARVFYFNDKEKITQYLALESLKDFTSLDSLNQFTSTYTEEKLLGAMRFGASKNDTEWENYNDECLYFKPLILFCNKADKDYSEITISLALNDTVEKSTQQLFNLSSILDFTQVIHMKYVNQIISEKYTPDKTLWDEEIAQCLKVINSKELGKVVWAKKKSVTFLNDLNALNLFKKSCQQQCQNYEIFFQLEKGLTFISITPERLFKLKDQCLYIDCLASTIARGPNAKIDEQLAATLKNSPKELEEHAIVVDEIKNYLSPLAQNIRLTKDKEILKCKHLQHLYTQIESDLKKTVTTVELMQSLHPTPAVGGKPKALAWEFINKFESFDRGFYAAPIGVLSGNSSDCAVAIRSCLIKNNNLHIYAGCGIVGASDPLAEWNESTLKMKNYEGIYDTDHI